MIRWYLAFGLGLSIVSCNKIGSRKAASKVASVDPDCRETCDWDHVQGNPAKREHYTLDVVPGEGVEKVMVVGSEAQNLPPSVHGIFWMDGNALAGGEVVSFAKMSWDLENRRMLDLSYGDNNYTFPADKAGLNKFDSTLSLNTTYEFTFNNDFTSARLVMTVLWNGIFVRIPDYIVDFTMHVDAQGDWVRESTIIGHKLPDYRLRRIVDAKGNRLEPAYSEYLKVAPKMVYLPRYIGP